MYALPQLLDFLNGYAAENPFPDNPKMLYEPCDYMLALGGKRLRPAMLLMAQNLFSDDIKPALPAAWSVELFHNFTLMHDDIMDAAPLRRGKATVHTKWNQTTGILSGDVMLIHAYAHLVKAGEPAIVPELIRSFNRVAIGVCEGQQYDVDFETRSDVSLPEYIRMIELKTAVLIGGALEMGALCAGASRFNADHLYEFGRLAGIAFQIQDDLLDTYGDPAKFGKQVGGDILQNKKTFLVLKTLEVAPEPERAALQQWMQGAPAAASGEGTVSGAEKIAAVRALFDRNGIPALVESAKQMFQDQAFKHLNTVDVPDKQKAVLRKMVEDLLVREY